MIDETLNAKMFELEEKIMVNLRKKLEASQSSGIEVIKVQIVSTTLRRFSQFN